MTDRELLELAAKAAGMEGMRYTSSITGMAKMLDPTCPETTGSIGSHWNPITDDGDALRLAVRLNLSADFFDDEILVGYTPNQNDCDQVKESVGDDPYAATRRAIVRAAAEIGRAMP